MVKLALISAVQIVPGVLQVTHLAFNLIQMMAHLTGVVLMRLSDVLDGFGKVLLVSDVTAALVFHILQLPFDKSTFAPLSGDLTLLFIKIIAPLILHRTKTILNFRCQGMQLFHFSQRHFHGLILKIHSVNHSNHSTI